MAVNGQELGHDPFNRRSTRPRKMGFKPVIPIEAAPAETVEMTASSGSHSTQVQIVGPNDNQVETSTQLLVPSSKFNLWTTLNLWTTTDFMALNESGLSLDPDAPLPGRPSLNVLL